MGDHRPALQLSPTLPPRSSAQAPSRSWHLGAGLAAVGLLPLPTLPGFTYLYPFCLKFAHRIGGWAS